MLTILVAKFDLESCTFPFIIGLMVLIIGIVFNNYSMITHYLIILS